MQVPRLSEDLLINNLWLIGFAVGVTFIVAWLGLVGGASFVRWLFRTTRVQTLVRMGDFMVKLARTVAVLASAAIVLTGLGLIGYSVWKSADYQVWADEQTALLTTELLWSVSTQILMLIGLVMAFLYFHRLGKSLLPRAEARLANRDVMKGHREMLGVIFAELPRCLTLILIFIVVHPVSAALNFPSWLAWLVITLSFVAMVMGSSRLVIDASYLVLQVADEFLERTFDKTPAILDYYNKLQALRALVRRVVEAIIYVAAATLIVARIETLAILAPYGSMTIELIAVFMFTRVVIELFNALIHNAMLRERETSEVERESEAQEAEQRRVTLTRMLQRLSMYFLYFSMVLWMLVVIGFNPWPLLAAAGVIGFAVGLGSQKILQDVICGFFILFEDQMLIGDYVKIDETEGIVEELFLRVVRIRDRLGRVHIMRNGDIANVINYSRGWTLAVVEMSVAYEADLDKVHEVMTEVGKTLHEHMPEQVVEPARVMGLEAMDESCLLMRIEAKVRPGCHYDVKWELNRLLFDAFNENKLEIPYPKSIEFDGTSFAS